VRGGEVAERARRVRRRHARDGRGAREVCKVEGEDGASQRSGVDVAASGCNVGEAVIALGFL
jgi:hypothetical protein